MIRQLLVAFTLGIPFLCLGDDLHYWVTYNGQGAEIGGSSWKTAPHIQARSPEMDFFQYARYSQKFLRKLDDNWTFGAHPAIEFARGSSETPWINHYRIEVEATGDFAMSKGPTLRTRTRWEFRWRDGRGSDVLHYLRQQFKATWKLEGWGKLSSFGLSNETFYEVEQGQIHSNRFFPLSVGFASSGKVKTGAWLMYLSKHNMRTSDWSGFYILGADLKF